MRLISSSRGLGFVCCLCWVALMHASALAQDAGPLAVGVAPFEGDQAGGAAIAEAVELELELVERVLVKGGRWMKRDLRQAGAQAYTPSNLKRILRKRKLDILIRGHAVDDRLWVYAYGKGGELRYARDYPLPDGVDASARVIVADMAAVIEDWEAQPTLRRDPARENQRGARGGAWDGGWDAPREPTDRDDGTRAGRRRIMGQEDAALHATDRPERSGREDAFPPGDEEADAPGRRTDERANGRRTSREIEDPDEWDTRREAARRTRGGARWDEADEAPGARAPVGAADLPSQSQRRSLADLDADSIEGTNLAPSHTFAAVAFGLADAWFYDFNADVDAQSVRVPGAGALAAFGGGARVSYWPWRNLGIDGDAHVSYMSVTVRQPAINPSKINTLAYTAGVHGRARGLWAFDGGAFGLGARLGYRFWGRGVELQTSQADNQPLTVVPGWQLHSASAGAELYLAWQLFARRFELDVHVDALPPISNYAEKPDNPGATSLAMGWSGHGALRIPVAGPLVLELAGYTLGSSITFTGRGDRLQRVDGEPVRVEGGAAFNFHGGGTLGLGVVF